MNCRRVLLTSLCIGSLSLSAHGGTTTYSLGPEIPLLDAAFYAGEAADGSNVAGRGVARVGVNRAGIKALLIAINMATFNIAGFTVQLGDPSSWARVTPDSPFAIPEVSYTPDDTLMVGNSIFDSESGGFIPISNNSITPTDISVTAMDTGNWFAAIFAATANTTEVILLPILPNGLEDGSRNPVVVTNLGITTSPTFGTGGLAGPQISRDATKLLFLTWDNENVPTVGNAYAINDLQAIINAPKISGTDISTAAPTSLGDASVVEVRASETANVLVTSGLSQDGSLAFLSEDLNNVYDVHNITTTIFAGAWRVVIANMDGTGTDTVIPAAGNMILLKPFPDGGPRYTFMRNFQIYTTSLEITNDISSEGTNVSSQTLIVDSDGDGIDDSFITGTNALQITSTTTIEDTSGIVLDMPVGQILDFPAGGSQEITIVTPSEPVAAAEIPVGINAIPVVRDFGPDGTQFAPPLVITFRYTDAEIGDLDESTLVPLLFNSGTNAFDILVPESDIVLRDPAANEIQFRVTSFSTYALGGTKGAALPLDARMLGFLTIIVAIAGSSWARRAHKNRS